MKQLKSIQAKPVYEGRLEKEVNKVMFDAIWREVMAVLAKYRVEKNFENSENKLRDSILKGRVQYSGNQFSGKIGAKESRALKAMGAKFDKRTKKWTLPANALPVAISSAVAQATQFYQNMHDDVVAALDIDKINTRISKSTFETEYAQNMAGLERQFRTSVQAIGVSPELSPVMVQTLSEKYSDNMKLYIQNWAEKNIVVLREKVWQNSFQGLRAENLVKIIQKDFNVSKNKAKFLAKQETTLLTSAFSKSRFESVGVQKYRWSTSHDDKVRGEHRELNGRVFGWDEAVIDDHGTRGNPGEAFGCRCKAIPILE